MIGIFWFPQFSTDVCDLSANIECKTGNVGCSLLFTELNHLEYAGNGG